MLLSSPKGILNCQSLSIHLPPLRDPRESSKTNYLSPPMSASPKHSKFGDSSIHNRSYHQQYTPPPTSQSKSAKQSPHLSKQQKSRPPSSRGGFSTSSSTADVETARTSIHFGSDSQHLREGSNEDSSSPQNSPEAHQLTSVAPGVARRAKAHVPSACVNCKRKHLACETKRPCNRCLSTGKEVTAGFRNAEA